MPRSFVSAPVALVAVAVLLALTAAPGPAQASRSPPPPLVNCLVAPCSTPECKKKCDAFKLNEYTRVQCVDNYYGGCNCDCCTPKDQICRAGPSVGNATAPCCAGTICDFSTSCVTDPRTKCGTICLNPADALSNCKRVGRTCDPSGKRRCCPGTSCQRTKPGVYKCAKCRGMEETCSSSKPCCPLLSCVATSSGGSKKCRLVAPAHP